jgi:hypothetical protein
VALEFEFLGVDGAHSESLGNSSALLRLPESHDLMIDFFHDASMTSNPPHSGVDDIKREYAYHNFLDRIVLYHFADDQERQRAEHLGWKTALPGSQHLFKPETVHESVAHSDKQTPSVQKL